MPLSSCIKFKKKFKIKNDKNMKNGNKSEIDKINRKSINLNKTTNICQEIINDNDDAYYDRLDLNSKLQDNIYSCLLSNNNNSCSNAINKQKDNNEDNSEYASSSLSSLSENYYHHNEKQFKIDDINNLYNLNISCYIDLNNNNNNSMDIITNNL